MQKRKIKSTVFAAAALTFVGALAGVVNAQDHHEPERGHDEHATTHADDRNRSGKMESNFRQEDRNAMAGHFNGDIQRLRAHPELRHNIARGGQLPIDFRSGLRPVPVEYIGHMPPAPAGYVYGYYDGYVVSYNPTTRIVADTLDLIAAALH